VFNILKRQVKKILGIAEAPAPKSVTPPDRKKKAKPGKTRKTERIEHPHGDKPRRKNERHPGKGGRNDRPARPRNVEVPVVTAKVRKERPKMLKDVPPAEGKMRFLDLPLDENVQFGVQNAGFEYCTPIQAMTLPGLLEGRDLAGKAQTGTGKTAAFLLAVFTKLLQNPREQSVPGQPRALVLAPTRELAIQIHKDAEALGIFTGLNNVVVFGGMNHEQQRRQLEEPVDVLIGTPGRVIDYSRSSSLDLRKVEILVIDEADRMLDMGFIPDIKRIVAHLPRKQDRQTLLFSATLEDSILRLASGWLVDPIIMESEPEKMVSDNIEQTFYSVLREEKLALILHILNHEEYERVIIFGNRKDVNLRLQHDLERFGFRVPVLSGDIPQDKRIRILEKFRKGSEKVVIATDVAARGIHVDNVSLVVNYDLPERPEDYVHRIGRTGRAGNKGKSISFLCEYGAYYLPDIEELLGVQFNSVLPPEEMLKLPERKKD
jgi:ATP-dependent RNA helicase RhlB